MATFIAYQPRARAPSSGKSALNRSRPVKSTGCISSGQSPKSPHQTTPVCKADFVDFVGLTASHLDTPQEYLVSRELLGPMGYGLGNVELKIARDHSDGLTCSDEVEAGEEGDNDDVTICGSDTSDLPSLREILGQSDIQFRGSDGSGPHAVSSPASVYRTSECGHESDCEKIANSTAATVTSAQPGASQDNPIVLDDDQSVDAHHDGTVLPDDERRTCEATAPRYAGDQSPDLPRESADPGTDDKMNTPDHPAKYNTDNRADHEQEGGIESHKDDAVHTRTLARASGGNECGGSGTSSDAPASVGHIHDVFAEYEETFGLPKSKHTAARSAMHDCPESEIMKTSVPLGVIQGAPRVATDDRITEAEQATEATGDDAACLSKRGFETGSTFRSRMEIEGQETEIVGAKSPGDPTLTGDYRTGNIGPLLQHPLPSPPSTPEAIRSDPDVAIQGTRTRKRSWSSTKSTTHLDTGAPAKRSRRAKKETWKAREAREARGTVKAERVQTPSGRYRKNKAPLICRDSPVSNVGKVADVEDVYLGEDGSIQCVVIWKPSLITMENLLSDVLRRRCEQLFEERYGHEELQRRRVTVKRQTKKK